MCFNLHRIPSVILFLPFWNFQSLRQNCRGLSQGGSSLSGALSEKERRSAGQSETFALTGSASPARPGGIPGVLADLAGIIFSHG